MTKEEILKSALDHHVSYDDDCGFGQIDLDTIVKMVKVGKKYGITFTFYKKVTALDDEFYDYRTITADSNHLFVFPSVRKEMGSFWREVEQL